jgi:hypothetical protein
VTRLIDQGAVAAAGVGVGMAVVTAVSFLLVIPIEPIYWVLAPLAGVLIGYYANQRSGRGRGSWRKLIPNAAFAGLATGLAFALLLLGLKGLFFTADNGFRDLSQGGQLSCTPGGDCVYARYLAREGGRARLEAAGVRDAASFSAFYWNQQLGTAGRLLVVTLAGSLVGGVLYGVAGPRSRPRSGTELAAGRT